ncbi:hypothetical protein [Lederbergia galactosidilytica]|uniref:Uncharacterized protein n=1 Tax=Lederbergia galactosidilytica TaxID=217031 RepID=A0A177ZQP0_9BACI|nr:hypothetical protein [Lederbergia galactosidilytica]OAK70064.1 hypothetical protein ABB05_12840 [Lederbergia galactosidilytica]
MSYTIEVIKKRTIQKVWWNFMLYETFFRFRKDVKRCELCEQDFNETDMTHLAFVENEKNHLICTECATTAIEGGAEKSERSKEDD